MKKNDKYNNVINVLVRASEYHQQIKKDKAAKWITVGVNTITHTTLKKMADFYGLSLSETMKIIISSSFKEFTEKELEPKGGRNGNS
jgi:hypothetical protein